LAKAVADNVVPQGLGDFPKISPEVVISGNPSIILGASMEEIARRPGWSKITAVRTGHVYELSKSESRLIARPGPRIAEGLRALARRLHPEAAL
jgi:iron complex transport system substrate-binding protein